jgi:hypothetical protein
LVEDFIQAAERLQDKLARLLRMAEVWMLKTGKGRNGEMGKNAGVAFVDDIFGGGPDAWA